MSKTKNIKKVKQSDTVNLVILANKAAFSPLCVQFRHSQIFTGFKTWGEVLSKIPHQGPW